jgi:hypothetical protein
MTAMVDHTADTTQGAGKRPVYWLTGTRNAGWALSVDPAGAQPRVDLAYTDAALDLAQAREWASGMVPVRTRSWRPDPGRPGCWRGTPASRVRETAVGAGVVLAVASPMAAQGAAAVLPGAGSTVTTAYAVGCAVLGVVAAVVALAVRR